ncbi:MAG: carotenoid 1,2-hydratase [bacterium]|nr:carotenoid 1,2-hydratase [bacterium]
MNRRLILLLFLMALAPVYAQTGWKQVMPGVELEYPRDHGAHPDTRAEWWYFTGQAADSSGRRFGYQFTIFRVGLDDRPVTPDESAMRARQILIGHLAVADIRNNRYESADRVRRAAAGFASAATDDMRAWIGDWSLARAPDDFITLDAYDREHDMGVSIELHPTKPLVYQGENGYSQKGEEPGNASAYVSWTRLETSGRLTWKGETFEVSGLSWFDHEYGSSQLGEGVSGWDWFGLHLDDGRDLMLYGLRGAGGSLAPQSGGTLIEADGSTRRIAESDFILTPLRTWTSPATGAEYPAAWRVEIPSCGLNLTVSSLVDDAELDARRSMGVVYWEGPVKVEGSITGSGYMELTGYATSLKNRF